MSKVTKHTKVRSYDGVEGKRRQVWCPNCHAPSVVYNFTWQERECPECHVIIPKTDWEVLG
jgi:ribosomal protein S27E